MAVKLIDELVQRNKRRPAKQLLRKRMKKHMIMHFRSSIIWKKLLNDNRYLEGNEIMRVRRQAIIMTS